MPAYRAWRTWALVAICLLAALLYGWELGADGNVGNTYYSAAIRSMTESLPNFLFGSFDPYGVITVDKPPMALWPQVISVLIFGYHGWSLLLPEVIAGVAAVFLLHRTVRLWSGERVALLAALIFALTPVTVAINRTNNPDTLLVLLLIAAAYAVTRAVGAAADRGRVAWLMWCAFFVGCGFLTKMLQAWIVVPALAVAYLVGATVPVRRRILELLGAGAVLVVSSFWWVALHGLWPGTKPYVGGSKDGSAWDLIIGYNGFGRVFGGGQSGGMVTMQNGKATMGSFGGEPGPLRMFNEMVGGQISWLLPLSLFVVVVVAVPVVRRGAPVVRAGWLLWSSWLVISGLVFSLAQGIMHPYYTTAMAPAVAALCAGGLAVLWRWYRASAAWVLLPVGVAVTAAWAFVLISRDTSWYGWCRWVVVAVAAAAGAGLVVGRLSSSARRSSADGAPVRRTAIARPALAAAIAGLLLTPGVWSVATATVNANGSLPAAGPPATGGMPGTPPPGGGPQGVGGQQPGNEKPGADEPGGGRPRGYREPMLVTSGGTGEARLSDVQRRVLEYARENGAGAEIDLAVNSSSGGVAPFIIDSDATVIGMGGFGGQDDAPSIDQLQRWTESGTLRFVLSAAPGQQPQQLPTNSPDRRSTLQQARQRWIEQHCTVVAPSTYGATSQSSTGPQIIGGTPDTLYDCS
ncbi:glycosyltransferase family 39 protein [Kribbella sp. HUAS MG21]|uniref:Glycosyltransferase family 39 protein n=1 Tax=Kribbella sp. HUAS MG21 TaxID=3160966 RepID=A0AAU7T5W5_9ACTN